ncbi:MAG TPA: glycosyltransferase N-terminal domain-containing protein [Gammaproteobacteria bacterium]|nr:glycosyltransferase N-terminal domain-containing protein [Gammaproteobacteria bacterium]
MLLRTVYSLILAPLWLIHYAWKTLQNPAYLQGMAQRLGLAQYPQAKIWIHGVSVGEINVALILRERILKNHPNTSILITCSTLTAKRLLSKNPLIKHCYLPVDLPLIIHRFLKTVQPQSVFFIESELWPNYLFTLQKKKIPLYLMNARISDRSYPRMLSMSRLYANLFKCFTSIQPASDIDRERMLSLGVNDQQLKTAANLKALGSAPPFSEKTYQQLITIKPHRSMIVIASTHPNEEALLQEKINTLAQYHQVVIIPRHPHRSLEVKKLFTNSSLYSEGLNPEEPIWIIDQIGLTIPFFKLANIVIMGGSFVCHGGHNPLEPAYCNVPIITGPHTHNFKELYQQFMQHHACLQWNTDQLHELIDLDSSTAPWQSLTDNAKKLAEKLNNQAEEALQKTLLNLSKVIE